MEYFDQVSLATLPGPALRNGAPERKPGSEKLGLDLDPTLSQVPHPPPRSAATATSSLTNLLHQTAKSERLNPLAPTLSTQLASVQRTLMMVRRARCHSGARMYSVGALLFDNNGFGASALLLHVTLPVLISDGETSHLLVLLRPPYPPRRRRTTIVSLILLRTRHFLVFLCVFLCACLVVLSSSWMFLSSSFDPQLAS